MAALLGFADFGGTPETVTRAKLIPNLFREQNQDSAELTPENTFKVNIVGLPVGLHNSHCIDVFPVGWAKRDGATVLQKISSFTIDNLAPYAFCHRG